MKNKAEKTIQQLDAQMEKHFIAALLLVILGFLLSVSFVVIWIN